MKNLFDFADEEIESIEEKSKDASSNIKSKVEEYSKLSENELISKLFENVEKQKQDGTFNFDELTNMVSKIRPYLNANQILQLEELLNKIK